MPYKVNPTTGQLDYYEVSEGGGGGVATNLSFIPSPTVGTVTSDSGTDADITLATTTNSGLFSPAEKIKLGIALTSVGVNYTGGYNNGADYTYGDVVLYNGVLYERISNPNNPGYPPGTSSWGVFEPLIGSPAYDLWISFALDNKVDVVAGKGLSTEDYTTAEQTKLAGIEAGAEVNVNADWNATSGDAQILNKPAIPASQVNSDWNATSGVSQVLNKPSIPASQVNVDWNATTGIEQILNKPSSLPTANVKHSVKYAEALTKGQAVYVSSADGTNMIVSKADNSSESTSSKTLGLVTASGAANYQGEVITEGLLTGLNTSTATAGDAVWLGTNGNLIFWHYGLTTKPVAPAHLVFIGIVTRVNANNGEIFVKPQNGFELEELHNVLITSLTNNQVLAYDSVTSLWKNKDLLNLTTTGYEGSATLSGNNLNIPQYRSVTYLGDFVGGDAYNAGDVVLYNNNLYYCILTIGSASAPSGDATHWDLFLPGASGGGGTQTLAQTLVLGNSVGSTDINMNSRNITNINNVSTSATTVQMQAILNQTLIFYSNNC